jgi:hypothetical protein
VFDPNNTKLQIINIELNIFNSCPLNIHIRCKFSFNANLIQFQGPLKNNIIIIFYYSIGLSINHCSNKIFLRFFSFVVKLHTSLKVGSLSPNLVRLSKGVVKFGGFNSNASKSIRLHILKDVVVVFHEAFHPSVLSSIHGWHHTRFSSLAEINSPPLCACVAV